MTPAKCRKSRTAVAAVVLAAISCLAPAGAAEPSPETASELYVPREDDFRAEYGRDAANRAKESWKDYWYWVKKFYDGDLLTRGWTRQSKEFLAVVRPERTRDELRAVVNDLGRRVAAEWSKDNGVRKINTADLLRFGKQLQEAKARDDGSGSSIGAALDSVRSAVDAKLTGR
jgi:hypothetical protein